jgi:hypothetical protein
VSGIDIRSGGLVAVDTASLREAAERYGREREELESLVRLLRDAAAVVSPLADPIGDGAPGRVDLVAGHLDTAAALAGGLGARLRGLADMYEFVELRAERAALAAAGDSAGAARLEARLRVLAAEDPVAAARAWAAELAWTARIVTTVAGPVAAGVLPPDLALATVVTSATIAGSGVARIGAAERLSGPAPAVAVRALGTRAGSAPGSLAAAVRRIPSSDGPERVRVERYAMPDGTRRFAVYVAGTRSASLGGGPEAFDMRSNLQLYSGRRSASYEATTAALAAAGARPGDAAYLFGHSQGGMIADRVAVEGGLDARLLVTVGSPTEADVGDRTLSVQLRHTDDPVAALAAGGSEGTVGARGSLVVERIADPLPGPHDLGLPAHHLSAYADTAAQLDLSHDPRVQSVRDALGELRRAQSVEVTVFAAERTDP